jgi:hypothetical protein
LLEERRQARVDLQPLLHQLGQRLGAALGGQAEGGAGSESSHPGGDRPVLLSSLRRDCMAAGGAEVQASTQVRRSSPVSACPVCRSLQGLLLLRNFVMG